MLSKIFVFACIILAISAQLCPGGRARIESAGTDDGNFIKILFPDTTVVLDFNGGNDPMGLWILTITGTTVQTKKFLLATNGLGSASENQVLKTYVDGIPAGTQVLVGTKGGAQWLDQVGMNALIALGATQWPQLGTARISFAMIGKKGATGQPQQFKLAKAGIAVIEGCITTNAPTCAAGSYYDVTAKVCKPCDASCAQCYDAPKTCSVCSANYQSVGSGVCAPSGGLVSCPTNTIKMNSMCISATCIDEIAKLTTVTGTCTEEATPTRRYKSNLVMTGFPMKQTCQYVTTVSFETIKDKKYTPVEFDLKLDDLGAQISFYNIFTDAKEKCPQDTSVSGQITYKCTFNATISMANVPQTTIWFKQTLVVNTDTTASLKEPPTIVQNQIEACTGDKCTFYISVASDVQQCANYPDCTGTAPIKKDFKRGDTIIIQQFIKEDEFKSYFLIPKSVRLSSTVTDIEIKVYQSNNNKAGQVVYQIPLVVALGTVNLDVTSTVSATKSLIRALQTTNKQKVVTTSQTITMSDDVQGPDGGLPEWAKILIGVLVGVTGAILIGLAIFCIHRKMKANKQQQNTQAKYQQEPVKEVEMNHN